MLTGSHLHPRMGRGWQAAAGPIPSPWRTAEAPGELESKGLQKSKGSQRHRKSPQMAAPTC